MILKNHLIFPGNLDGIALQRNDYDSFTLSSSPVC